MFDFSAPATGGQLTRVAATIALLTLAGCADKKAPSDANFVAAIDARIGAEPYCERLPRSNARLRPDVVEPAAFPINLVAPEHGRMHAGAGDTERAMLDGLVAAGVLAKLRTTVDAVDGYGNFAKPIRVPAVSYVLTDAGKTAVAVEETTDLAGRPLEFSKLCFGRAKVAEIVRATEPTDAGGRTVARVGFRWTIENAPAWATTPAVAAAFPRAAQAAGNGASSMALLELTTDGWSVVRLR
jgi:hypothetical protein